MILFKELKDFNWRRQSKTKIGHISAQLDKFGALLPLVGINHVVCGVFVRNMVVIEWSD